MAYGAPPMNCPHSAVNAPDSPGGLATGGFSDPQVENFWHQVLVQVLSAGTAIDQGNFAHARALAADALSAATNGLAANPEAAFGCSLGVAAAYRVLAAAFCRDATLGARALRRARQIALRFQHLATVWVTHVWEKFARREEPGTGLAHYHNAYIDESAWPISIQDINVEMTIVQRELAADGLAQGHVPRWREVPIDFRDRSLRFGIVSLCAYPPEQVLPRYAKSNHRIYAERHGYKYRVGEEIVDKQRPPAWGKIQLVYEALREDDVDWWLWFDCDTFFMNMTVTLDSVLYKYAASAEARDAQGLPTSVDPNLHMLVAEDHAMLNTGAFFLRSSSWSSRMLEQIWGPTNSVWVDHPWWENAAIIWNFLKDSSAKFRDDDPSASYPEHGAPLDELEGIYPTEVRLAPQSEFNSYHPATSHFQHDTWAVGKFVLAFNGVLSNTSPDVVQILYGNYYRLACELNWVQDQCVEVDEALPWLREKPRQ